jgi:predicted NBD/HSP70 family sugar kinase
LLGIDIGGDKILALVADLDGEILRPSGAAPARPAGWTPRH